MSCMKKQIYIIGHKKPDTDSVASAIAYADLKNKIKFNDDTALNDEYEYIPAVCGRINSETDFILNKFGLSKPFKITDVRTQVKDFIGSDFTYLTESDSIQKAGTLISQNDISAVPVAKENGEYSGLISLHTLSKLFLEQMNIVLTDEMQLKFSTLIENLHGQVYVKNGIGDNISGKVFIGAMARANLGKFICKGDIVIIGNRSEALLQLIDIGVQMLIISGGQRPDEHVLQFAKEKGVTVIGSSYHTYKTVRLFNLSIPASARMDKVSPLNENDYLSEVADKIRDAKSSLPVVDDNNKLVGMVSRRGLSSKYGKKVILVDHNDKSQAVNGIEEADILEIIDHHNKSDIITKRPIYSRQEPIGSTASLIKKIYDENQIEISKDIALVLMSAIISDTLYLKSTTATKQDEIILNDLGKIADVDLDEFALEIFEAKSQVASKSAQEILDNDRKDFKVKDVKFTIGQIETVKPSTILNRRDELLKVMRELKKAGDYKAVFLMITDIFNNESHALICTEDNNILSHLGVQDSYLLMKGVMSRKSDFLPKVYELF